MPSPIPNRHQGKVAIVTGAGQGIGLAVALRLAQEGASVVIAEINPVTCAAAADQIRAVGGEAWAYPFDAGNIDQIGRLAPDVVAHYGKIDILINNAGVSEPTPIFDLTPETWDRLFDVNARGVYFCMQVVAQQMVEQADAVRSTAAALGSYGKIVNISSVAGRKGRQRDPAYAATKATVISITQAAASRLAPLHINVNAVCPGIIPTAMWDNLDHVEGGRHGLPTGEWLRRRIERIPQQRAGTVEDVAASVSFLCSEDADHITGQALNVDGGIEMN